MKRFTMAIADIYETEGGEVMVDDSQDFMIGVAIGVLITVAFCMICMSKSDKLKDEHDYQVLEEVCNYIYENKDKEVYTSFCE